MEKYKTEIEKYIGTAEFDEGSGFIFGKQPDNTLNLVAEVRGWGAIQNMFEEQSEAQKFQDELGSYIADAINKKTKDNWKNESPNDVKHVLPADWRGLDCTPPDELVEVIDADGNKAHAYPTWYPFKVVPNPNKVGKWTSDVVPCEPYWDGGWMIECIGLTNNVGTVVGWKPICR